MNDKIKSLLKENPMEFIENYVKYTKEEIKNEAHQLDYIPSKNFKSIKNSGGLYKISTEIRNRRYSFITNTLKNGDYFSLEEIRNREPLLYEQYFGSLLDGDFKTPKTNISTFSQFLHDHLCKSEITKVLASNSTEETNYLESIGESFVSDMRIDHNNSDDSIQLLQREFFSIIFYDFLSGNDPFFDYSTVDNNPKYDDLNVINKEVEDEYFDSEEPKNIDLLDN